jgi:hypothetical protein
MKDTNAILLFVLISVVAADVCSFDRVISPNKKDCATLCEFDVGVFKTIQKLTLSFKIESKIGTPSYTLTMETYEGTTMIFERSDYGSSLPYEITSNTANSFTKISFCNTNMLVNEVVRGTATFTVTSTSYFNDLMVLIAGLSSSAIYLIILGVIILCCCLSAKSNNQRTVVHHRGYGSLFSVNIQS